MPFPESERVIYDNSPLNRVICQIRYPAILKIGVDRPHELQEVIRDKFPLYSEATTQTFPISFQQNMNVVLPQNLPNVPESKSFIFHSEDKNCQFTLTMSYFSLTTLKYSRWEEFRDRITFVLEQFNNIYKPSFFTRLGLRYIDIINKEQLNIPEKKWSDLLKPYIIGAFSGDSNISNNIRNNAYHCEIKLEDNESFVNLNTALGLDLNNQNSSYYIDSDFYNSKKKNYEEVITKLEYLNSRASRLIRWAITEELHNLMKPKPIK